MFVSDGTKFIKITGYSTGGKIDIANIFKRKFLTNMCGRNIFDWMNR